MNQFFYREQSLGEVKPDKRNKDISAWFVQTADPTDAATPHFLGVHFRGRQRLILLLGVAFIFLLLLGRAAYLQIFEGVKYLAVAEGNRQRVYLNYPPRGVFYDARQRQLIGNVPGFTLAITPSEWPADQSSSDALLDALSVLLMLDVNSLKQTVAQKLTAMPTVKQSNQPLTIESNLSQAQAMILKTREAELPGISLLINGYRRYLPLFDLPFEREFQHQALTPILGYMGRINADEWPNLQTAGYGFDENIGQTGLEATFQSSLRGVPGTKIVEVDATGRMLKTITETQPKAGDNLQLSLDAAFQIKAAALTKDWLLKLGKTKAAIVVMKPQTGELISLLQWPSYSYDIFSPTVNNEAYRRLLTNPGQPLFPRALAGAYPPGSTIKLIVAAAGLEEKIIDRATSFLSTGGLNIDQWYFPDWQAGGHGQTNVTKAIAESVNTFFYILGGGRPAGQSPGDGREDFTGLGVDKLTDYFEKFGLGHFLGIDLPGEAAGFLPSKTWKETVKGEPWYVGDTYHLAIGQGDISVTPLQVAAMTAVIANNGTLYRPHVVTAFMNDDNNDLVPIEPQVLNQNFIKPENLAVIRQGMREAVTVGSARYLQTLPFETAGKTGTAQWHSVKPPHSWFTGFAPYDDPEVVITVLIEEGGEGTSAALRLARDLFALWGEIP